MTTVRAGNQYNTIYQNTDATKKFQWVCKRKGKKRNSCFCKKQGTIEDWNVVTAGKNNCGNTPSFCSS